jgi:hypothetical protein
VWCVLCSGTHRNHLPCAVDCRPSSAHTLLCTLGLSGACKSYLQLRCAVHGRPAVTLLHCCTPCSSTRHSRSSYASSSYANSSFQPSCCIRRNSGLLSYGAVRNICPAAAAATSLGSGRPSKLASLLQQPPLRRHHIFHHSCQQQPRFSNTDSIQVCTPNAYPPDPDLACTPPRSYQVSARTGDGTAATMYRIAADLAGIPLSNAEVEQMLGVVRATMEGGPAAYTKAAGGIGSYRAYTPSTPEPSLPSKPQSPLPLLPGRTQLHGACKVLGSWCQCCWPAQGWRGCWCCSCSGRRRVGSSSPADEQ